MIGKIIKYMRKNKGYTQKELAEIIGVAQTTLSGYETGYSSPVFDIIKDISENCDYEIIFVNKTTRKQITINKN